MPRFTATLLVLLLSAGALAAEQPNILWITCEDISPNLGCYRDHYSVTPNLDGLAAKGMRYLNAISNAPVCAADDHHGDLSAVDWGGAHAVVCRLAGVASPVSRISA